MYNLYETRRASNRLSEAPKVHPEDLRPFETKKQKLRGITNFSSEDSQNTDHSIDSSLEIAESNAERNHSKKFNQLRETMNQYFLANPELAEEIKFDKIDIAEEQDHDAPNPSFPGSPAKKGFNNMNETFQGGLEESNTNLSSAKFWTVISKEMTKPQKNSKMPTLNQINHVLNIFKSKFEKGERNEANFSPAKSPALKKSKSDFRIHSAKVSGEKLSVSSKYKESKNQGQGNQNNHLDGLEEEDGVKYYSFRKKMHLQFKQKRMQREKEEQKKRKQLEAERERLAKEREQQQMMFTLAGLDEEMKKGIQVKEPEDNVDEASRAPKQKGRVSRKNSLKGKGDIFERLTKDMNNKNGADEEEEPHTKRTFISPFAETLYKDMKAFGDAEAFKKIAQAKIMNYKKEFKEKLAKQKQQFPMEALKFTKEKNRYLNMFVPDFDKTMSVADKEAIFAKQEIHRESEEWKENPEYEILAKFQKIRNGNILEFWRDAKDLNQ